MEEKQKRKTVREELADKFVGILESDKPLQWVKEWSTGGYSAPYNGQTGRKYNGVNRFVLMFRAIENNWTDPRYMGDDPRPIVPGTKGTVRVVDDIGTVHCDFDNGRRLGLVPGEDSFHLDTKERYIKVVLCEPGKKARVTTILNTLESLQHMVGDSYIECIYPFDDPVGIVCDEEGKLNQAELNRSLRDENGKVYDIIAGPFLVVGLSEDDFASLSKEHQDKYYKMFEHPERFFRVGNEIQSVNLPSQEKLGKHKHI